MSRPKGSINNKNKKFKVEPKRKRGRPKNIVIEKTEEPIVSNAKVIKFIGFCNSCNFSICSPDLIKKTIFECPSCNKKDRISKLNKVSSAPKYESKKDYLESTAYSKYNDMPVMNDHEIVADDFKQD